MSYIVKVIPAPAGTSSTNVLYVSALGGTVVDLNSTQTLTNKTLTNAVISGSNTTLTNATITGGTVANASVSNATLSATNAVLTTPVIAFHVSTLAATGGNFSTANTYTGTFPVFLLVTGANGTNGITFQTTTTGRSVVVQNSPSANAALKVYPPVNCQINEAGANTALTVAANSSCELFIYNSTHWYSNPKVPS